MDWLSLLMNAEVRDQEGTHVGPLLGFEVKGNRMVLTVVLSDDDLTDGGGDDGGGEEVVFTPDLKLVSGGNHG